jgi:CRP-like cAMP-binding protein
MPCRDRRRFRSKTTFCRGFPLKNFKRLLPNLHDVSLSLGEVVYELGGHLNYIYFPTTSVVSLLYTTEDGTTAEMGLAGNDGIVGVALFLGGETTPNRAVVQIAGAAVRMDAKLLQMEFARGGPLQRLLLRYTQALITQISQTAVWNRLHSVEKRLCRWLLLSTIVSSLMSS